MLVSGESLQSSRCTCCGGNRQNPQQVRLSWLPLSSLPEVNTAGKRMASALASQECLWEPVLANTGNDILCFYKFLVWQGALPFRKTWQLPRSASRHNSPVGKKSANTLACSKKDDSPTDRQSDSNKKSSAADSHDDLAPLRKLIAARAEAEKAPKPKFSLQNAVAREWKAFTSLVPM